MNKEDELQEEIKELKSDKILLTTKFEETMRVVAQVRDQRTNIAKQLGRSEENLLELRNKHARQQRALSTAQSQIIRLVEWCQKKFPVNVVNRIGQPGWPIYICDVVAKVVDESQVQIGWYNPNSGQFCALGEPTDKPTAYQHFIQPVFMLGGVNVAAESKS